MRELAAVLINFIPNNRSKKSRSDRLIVDITKDTVVSHCYLVTIHICFRVMYFDLNDNLVFLHINPKINLKFLL